VLSTAAGVFIGIVAAVVAVAWWIARRARATQAAWQRGPEDADTLAMAAWAKCAPYETPEQSGSMMSACYAAAGFPDAEEKGHGHKEVAEMIVERCGGDLLRGMQAVTRLATESIGVAKWFDHPRVLDLLAVVERDTMDGLRRMFPPPTEESMQALGEALRKAEADGIRIGEPVGPRMRQLLRRRNNPLFSPERRNVSRADIAEAQSGDAAELAGIEGEFREILARVETLGDTKDWATLRPLRETIGHLHARAVRADEPAESTAANLWKLHESLVDTVIDHARRSGDSDAVQALENARSLSHRQRDLFLAEPFLAQVSDIPSDELVPSLLCEEPETVRRFVRTLRDHPEAVANVRAQAEALAASVGPEVQHRFRLTEKIAALAE
jgi:hypothetical protein